MINPHKWIRNLTKTWRVSKRKKTITGPILPLADTAASRSLNPDMSLITFSFRFVKRKMMNELFLKKQNAVFLVFIQVSTLMKINWCFYK